MIQASCYYIHFNRGDEYIIFIRYDDMIKIYINGYSKWIIISFEDLLNNSHLYNYYLLSLLLTENPNKLSLCNNKLYISSKKDWKRMHFITNYENNICLKKNVFLQKKPTKITTSKKIKKFKKAFNSFLNYCYYPNSHYYPLINTELGTFDDYLYKQFENELDEIEYEFFILNEEHKRKNIIKKICCDKYILPKELMEKIYLLSYN